MKLNKKDVDEFIRVVRKYYASSDTDTLPKLGEVRDKFRKDYHLNYVKADIVESLARLSQINDRSYQVVYDCLKVFGFEIVEEKGETK